MNTLKKIKRLDVEADAVIELVELDGKKLILKTAEHEEISLDKKFIQVLAVNNLPHLEIFEIEGLLPNQLLMEYLDSSPTLNKFKNIKWFRKWGEITYKMHQVKSNKSQKILADGKVIDLDWADFIKDRLQQNIERHRKNKSLDESSIQQVETIVNFWLGKMKEEVFSLIHGDLHTTNAMIKNDDVILFDKGSFMLFGNRIYDLATVAMYYYGNKDRPLIEAFIDGYGENFLLTNKQELETWIILRCFERYPNRFESYSIEILNDLLKT